MITVISVSKSNYTASTARTYLVTDAHYTRNQIIDAGLAAMNEDRSSLFGFGIENLTALGATEQVHDLPPAHYVVYAYRD